MAASAKRHKSINVIIRNFNMFDGMKQDAVKIAKEALEKFQEPERIANFIKTEFSKKHSNITWECSVSHKSAFHRVNIEWQYSIHLESGDYVILLYNKNCFRKTDSWGLSCWTVYSRSHSSITDMSFNS